MEYNVQFSSQNDKVSTDVNVQGGKTFALHLFKNGQTLEAAMQSNEQALDASFSSVQVIGGGGSDGFSPIVDVEPIEGGHRLTITDAQGTETADIMDGQDGISPVVSVEDIDGGHRVTITDKDGEKVFDVMDGKDGEGGGSGDCKAIVDVTELPETDIKEDVFYRVLTAEYWYNSTPATIYTCRVVETLPVVGEPITDATMSEITSYYVVDTGENSGYLTAELGAALGGLPAGWYPTAALFQAVGVSYGGTVGNLDEMQDADTLYLYLQESLKYRNNDAWGDVQSIGWRGTGNAAEVFNTLRNVSSGSSSHAEGYSTTASGDQSHAEGYSTTASGNSSHAEGRDTTASGHYSHAEGHNTTASGDQSHAEGWITIAASISQHVQGKYNIGDASGKYAHIVGNGDVSTLSNAHTLDWNGVSWYQSRPQFGGNAQDDGSQSVMANGDTEIILKSPNGSLWGITVSDDGVLTVTAK